MGLEFELKYRATPEILQQIQAAYPGGYTHFQMTTTYFDTPDGSLSARHWTLRHRQENDAHICTLKTPAGTLGRGEWEYPCSDIHAAIPVLAEASGMTELLTLTANGINAACGARFLRLAKLVELGSATAELALDCGILRGGSRELPFAEVELELKSGPREELVAFGSIFARKFSLEPQPQSKYARARALKQEDSHGI